MNKVINSKMILSLSVLLIFLLAGAVSAASEDVNVINDDSNSRNVLALNSVGGNDTVSTDAADEQVVSSGESEILSDDSAGTFTDLQNELNNASNSLILNRDYQLDSYLDSTSGITINHDNFVLDGNNHIVDARKLGRIFTISGNNVTLKNIVLNNAFLDNTFDISELNNVSLGYNGAPIEWVGDDATLTNVVINNSYISNMLNCKASDISADYIMGNGAIAFYSGNILISNLNISNSHIITILSDESENNDFSLGNVGGIFFNNTVHNLEVSDSEIGDIIFHNSLEGNISFENINEKLSIISSKDVNGILKFLNINGLSVNFISSYGDGKVYAETTFEDINDLSTNFFEFMGNNLKFKNINGLSFEIMRDYAENSIFEDISDYNIIIHNFSGNNLKFDGNFSNGMVTLSNVGENGNINFTGNYTQTNFRLNNIYSPIIFNGNFENTVSNDENAGMIYIIGS